MAWLYLPDTVASSLESTPPSETSELWVTLSGKATPRPLSWRGWKNRPYVQLLSGMTLPPLTATRGVELWISSLRDSHVSPSVPQEDKRAQKTSDGCGMILSESFAKYGPDGSLVKTSQDLFGSDSTPYSGRLPKWGMMYRGELFELTKWEPPIDASEYSSSLGWPQTPMASDGEGGMMEVRSDAHGKYKLRDYGASWPNMENWPTITASEGTKNAGRRRASDRVLNEEAKNWPTPAARDEKGANAPPMQRKNATGRMQMNQLPNYVAHSSHLVPKTSTCGPECSPKHRRLNPQFVEWLMGLPSCWTVAKIGSGPAATALSHYKQQLQSECSRIARVGL